MSRSDQLDQLATALAAAQAEFTAIPKTDTNPFFKSKYAGLPKVIEVASPILNKHGLSVSQLPGTDEQGNDTLVTYLLHKSGQFISSPMRLHLPKDDPQGHGSALTYARRYSYMAALGLVADEDDDGNQAARSASRAEPDVQPITKADIVELVNAADGLDGPKVKLALASVGLDGVTTWGQVPKAKLPDVIRALGAARREAP